MALIGRQTLQLCVALGALVPVIAGAWGMLDGLGSHGAVTSHERYLSGLLFAIGVAFWSTIPNIEKKTGRFRLLTALVLVGGVGRLLGAISLDGISGSIAGALSMELAVTPLLCMWQGRLVGSSPVAPVGRSWPVTFSDGLEDMAAKLYAWRKNDPPPTYERTTPPFEPRLRPASGGWIVVNGAAAQD